MRKRGKEIEEMKEFWEMTEEEALQVMIDYYNREIEKLKKHRDRKRRDLALLNRKAMEEVRWEMSSLRILAE